MKKILLSSFLLLTNINIINCDQPTSLQDATIDEYLVGWENPSCPDYKNLKNIFSQNYENLVIGAPHDKLDHHFNQQITDTNNFADQPILTVIRDVYKNIVGFITYVMDAPSIGSIGIRLLAIDKNYQKMGFGRRLIEYVTQHAKNTGIKRIELLSASYNLDFYHKNGFSPINTFNWTLKDGSSMPIYTLEKKI